ncbi:MAG: TrkH family potassium uptake protein [Clostridia bacterium]|nr:TrkH family potassium uptake protein [Clostridia bacterium]
MNYRMVLNIIGRIVMAEAGLLILPVLVSLYYGETTALHALLITAGIALAVGLLFVIVSRTKNRSIYAGEGFVSVAFAWMILSAIGALPFYISGAIPSYVDALFETVSGFTTTGASIIQNVESIEKSLLFWRSFTHWVGGMGVLVFVMAIIPGNTKGTMNVMRAEMPGPIIGKLVPRVKDTAKILYLIYIALTALEITMLYAGGMPLFDSVVHSLGTAGTGGFGIKADSIASYTPYMQWVITVFMLIFGLNFNLYYLILMRRIRSVLKSEELWCYVGIVVFAVAAITANVYSMYDSFSAAFRHSAFQVSSIITTTGFTTTNFDLWPGFSKGILFTLMFIGGCAGSTAGGLKVSRVVMLFKLIGREIRKILHPRSVNKISFEGKNVDENTLDSVTVYLVIYIVCFVAIFLLLCIEPFSLETNISAAAACYNNVGPGFAGVGPTTNFSAYSDFSTIVLSFAMLLGRLEIFPLIIALSPSTWSRKYR